MDAQERIIRRLFTEQQCHYCGRPYEPERMLVLARRTEVWMVMISCGDCEQKDTYVIKFPPQMQGRRSVTSYRLSRPSISKASTPSTPLPQEPQQNFPEVPETPRLSGPVNADDVLDMYLFLKNFNGDFQRLFAEVE
jgi:hypothetical protein